MKQSLILKEMILTLTPHTRQAGFHAALDLKRTICANDFPEFRIGDLSQAVKRPRKASLHTASLSTFVVFHQLVTVFNRPYNEIDLPIRCSYVNARTCHHR